MKTVALNTLLILALAACSRPEKDLANIKIGMTKDQVVSSLGEPEKKDVVNKTELWNFTDSSRTVVFRADTVYAIMTSPQARIDSMASWLDKTDDKVASGFGRIGDKIGNVADKVGNKLKKDSSKTK